MLLQNQPLNMLNYNRKGIAVVQTGTVLPSCELFGIRKHTRFADFPKHTHEYVEMVYQVKGHTRHTINDVVDLTLEEGQLLFPWTRDNARH